MADIEREKLIDKIRKIQRKAEGTTSAAEADTFLDKMSKLMEENGISMADLKEKDLTHGFGFSIYNLNYSDAWRKSVMFAVARLCGCVAILQMGQDKTPMKIYGRPENVEIAVETYIYIHKQIQQICRSLYPGDRKSYLQAQKGIAHGVQVKIHNIMQTMMSEAAAGSVDTKVPMVIESQIVGDFIKRTTNTVPLKMRLTAVTAASIVGYHAADRVDVRKKVN